MIESAMQLAHAIFEPNGEGPHPTIVALHGWGANAMDLLGLAPHLGGGRFLTICPQGPLELPIGYGAVGYGWFPLREGGPTDAQAVLSARNKLRAFLDEALARYPVNREKLALLGFSQGGAMAYALALAEPERFAAIASLSSWLPPELVEASPPRPGAQFPPMLVQHGALDELVAIDRARDSVERLRGLRAPLTYREYEMGHEIIPQSLADLSAWLEEKILSPIILLA